MVSEMLNVKVDKMTKFNNESAVKALCDLLFGDLFLIRGFSVVEGEKGIFVSMPRKQSKNGKWFNVFTPATNEIREYLTEVVLDAYKNGEEKG